MGLEQEGRTKGRTLFAGFLFAQRIELCRVTRGAKLFSSVSVDAHGHRNRRPQGRDAKV